MGLLESKTQTVYIDRTPTRPETPPLTTQPWRDTEIWTDALNEKLFREIKKNQTGSSDVKDPNLLLLGPVGAGKSSLINSLCSVGKGRIANKVETGSSEKSYTKKLTRVKGAGVLRNFRLCDTMGVEDTFEEGFHVSDVMNLIEGRIKPTYQFNPRSPIQPTDSAYNQNPNPKDKTHCVIFVVDAQMVESGSVTQNMRKKIHDLQEQIKEKGIPRVLILTKVDKLCQEVDNDIQNIFKSTKVEKAVQKAAEVFAIPESNIHPVRNYAKDIQIDPLKNIPLLFALRQIVHFATDYLEDDDEDSDEEEEEDDTESENDWAYETESTSGREIRKSNRIGNHSHKTGRRDEDEATSEDDWEDTTKIAKKEGKRKVLVENESKLRRKYKGEREYEEEYIGELSEDYEVREIYSRENKGNRRIRTDNVTQYTGKYCGEVGHRGKTSDIWESKITDEEKYMLRRNANRMKSRKNMGNGSPWISDDKGVDGYDRKYGDRFQREVDDAFTDKQYTQRSYGNENKCRIRVGNESAFIDKDNGEDRQKGNNRNLLNMENTDDDEVRMLRSNESKGRRRATVENRSQSKLKYKGGDGHNRRYERFRREIGDDDALTDEVKEKDIFGSKTGNMGRRWIGVENKYKSEVRHKEKYWTRFRSEDTDDSEITDENEE